MNKNYELDIKLNTQAAKQSLSALGRDFSNLSKNIDYNLGKSLKNLINGTKTLKQVLKETAYEITKTQIQNIVQPNKSATSSIIGGLAKFAGVFDSGGVVPGSFSQPKSILAHGSEMILNPSQQANLFSMINNGGKQGGNGEANYVYAPQIKTSASANEVFDVLQKHSRQFFAMVSDGVQKDSNLRNSVRSA